MYLQYHRMSIRVEFDVWLKGGGIRRGVGLPGQKEAFNSGMWAVVIPYRVQPMDSCCRGIPFFARQGMKICKVI